MERTCSLLATSGLIVPWVCNSPSLSAQAMVAAAAAVLMMATMVMRVTMVTMMLVPRC